MITKKVINCTSPRDNLYGTSVKTSQPTLTLNEMEKKKYICLQNMLTPVGKILLR